MRRKPKKLKHFSVPVAAPPPSDRTYAEPERQWLQAGGVPCDLRQRLTVVSAEPFPNASRDHKLEGASAGTAEYIRARPYAAVGLALAFGYLVGRLRS
jgi:hypothetical protein